MRNIFIRAYFLLARISVAVLPYGILYNWPDKRFRSGKFVPRSELAEILSNIWPRNVFDPLIRLGTNGDGGYLVPNIKVDCLFSAGVERNIDFEFDLTKKYNCPIFMLDKSVSQLPLEHKNFHFEEIWLGSKDSEETVSINTWIDTRYDGRKAKLALKIDIEGAEYEVLSTLDIEKQKNLVWIVCEFHSFENILMVGEGKILEVFHKLMKTHKVVHIHPNNLRRPFSKYGFKVPSDLEVTFLRNDLCFKNGEKVDLPHILDVKNNDKPNYSLNWCELCHD